MQCRSGLGLTFIKPGYVVQIRGNEAIWELGVSKICMYMECTKHKKIYHCLAMIVTVGSCNNTYVIGRIPGIGNLYFGDV